MKRQAIRFKLVAFGIGLLFGCQTFNGSRAPLHASLVTDSTEVTAYHRGSGYVATIGFTFTNNTGRTISRAGCGGPGWPGLEKKVNTRWISAYHPVVLACRTYPDFSWQPGAQIRDALRFVAYERGHNTYPQINVDSIDGTYRLRWSFTEGREAGAKGARNIEAISNEFYMKLSSSSAPASITR